MITSPIEVHRPLASLAQSTCQLLKPLGLHKKALPEDLAAIDGEGQRPRLTASRWDIGPAKAPVAECRMVCIRGRSSDIVNTLIFPHQPGILPTFVAEILVLGGRPRVTFVDVQVPGLRPDRVQAVAEQTAGLARQFAPALERQEAPAWSAEYSTGGYVFSRPSDPSSIATILDLYHAYLATWIDFAMTWRSGNDNTLDSWAHSQLVRYKRHHVEYSPVKDFLGKVFGADWADRFLSEFLYQ